LIIKEGGAMLMSKPELRILIGLHRAANAIDRQTARAVAPFGLTLGQFAVLEALYHKGDLTVGETQEAILSSSGTIPLIVSNLEKRGYLIRRQDPKDRRRFVLTLTAEGRKLISEAYPVNEKIIIERMDCWTDSEKDTLASLLRKFGGTNGKKN